VIPFLTFRKSERSNRTHCFVLSLFLWDTKKAKKPRIKKMVSVAFGPLSRSRFLPGFSGWNRQNTEKSFPGQDRTGKNDREYVFVNNARQKAVIDSVTVKPARADRFGQTKHVFFEKKTGKLF
jgi:hypothetical protein